MKYSRFAQLVVGVGTVAVLATVFLSLRRGPIVEEAIAQLMLIGVLIGAVYWGRNGGFVAAVVATVTYAMLRIPMVADAQGLTGTVATLVVIRMVTYALVGVVGGEVCGRIKYVFAALENSSAIDEWTRVYNQRYIARIMQATLAQYRRYETPFSAVVISLAPGITENLRPSKARSILRAVASHIRNDVRLVDEVGRLDDGRFIVLLPSTPRAGGVIAAERLRSAIRDLIGAKEESVVAAVWGTPDDIGELETLTESVQPPLGSEPATA